MEQISLKAAVRNFLCNKPVKVVDFERDEIRDLAEVMKALGDGAIFFSDKKTGQEFQDIAQNAAQRAEEAEAQQQRLKDLEAENEKLKAESQEMREDNVKLTKLLEEKEAQLEKMKVEYGDLSVKYAELEAKLPAAPDPEEAAAVERLKSNPKKDYRRKLSREEFLDSMARKRGEL